MCTYKHSVGPNTLLTLSWQMASKSKWTRKQRRWTNYLHNHYKTSIPSRPAQGHSSNNEHDKTGGTQHWDGNSPVTIKNRWKLHHHPHFMVGHTTQRTRSGQRYWFRHVVSVWYSNRQQNVRSTSYPGRNEMEPRHHPLFDCHRHVPQKETTRQQKRPQRSF